MLILPVTAEPAMTLDTAALHAAHLATSLQLVVALSFNDTTVDVSPGSHPNDVVSRWWGRRNGNPTPTVAREIPRIVVDHVDTGYVLLDCDAFDHFAVLGDKPFATAQAAIAAAHRERRERGYATGVTITVAAFDAAIREARPVDSPVMQVDMHGRAILVADAGVLERIAQRVRAVTTNPDGSAT
jgi:hypothetical protein